MPVHRATLVGRLAGAGRFHGPFTMAASIILADHGAGRRLRQASASGIICIAASTGAPSAFAPDEITLSTRLYGLRMNPRSAPCGRNHDTRRSGAQPL